MANTVVELVFIPAPAVGHIMSTVEMAKVLVNHDQRLSITVLLMSSPYPVPTLTTYTESLFQNTIERIRFIELPQDQTKLDTKARVNSFIDFINSHCKHVRNIVADMINQTGSGRVVGFVVDITCGGMIDVANEFDLPTYVFFTSTAAYLGFNLYIETTCVNQNQDVIELINSEGEIVLPSFVNPVPTKVVRAVSQIDEGLDFLIYSFRQLRKAKGIMINTFLELETHAMKSFPDTNFPHVYPVGPVLNLDGVAGKAEDMDVIRWLDDQPPSSVVVLCFGSMGSFNEVQVKEIARGLEQSGRRFVWSLRRPPHLEQSSEGNADNYDGVLPDGFMERTLGTGKVIGWAPQEIARGLEQSGHRFVWSLRRPPQEQTSEGLPDNYDWVLPDGFLERTSRIGKVIGWAPQVSLLAHEAVGGFVSHCGWNSMLESLWFGVPTAAWPMYAEQQLNAFEMVVELGLAVDMKLDYKMDMFNPDANTVTVTAEEIERGIRQVMEDNEVRAKVKEMSKLSRATVAQGGSSYASVDYLVHEIMSNII
ncbi:putative flavonol 3-O-glucosyltransferase [Helianthus annuus]|uniref:Glycosyltransferase n=1 Tax=Helianthus annuus TaxID=4232 RepID=A0A9K3NXU1_HELAN|nr:putative flavonol 3-O-glucosyltransferase [Helianthus annuus]